MTPGPRGEPAPSLWTDTGSAALLRPPLDGDATVDVVIVGAGYSGLWTALTLRRLDPALSVLVVEAERVGFGASGRNGGWCSGQFPVDIAEMGARFGRAPALAMATALSAAVRDVGAQCASEGIDAEFVAAGTLTAARTPRQMRDAEAEVELAHASGLGDGDVCLLSADEARGLVGASRTLGGVFSPHCAALHPQRLVHGLALAAERHGVRIVERTRAERIEPFVVTTDRGTIRASIVVRATEGWTPELPGLRRRVVPVYSLMIATRVLTDGDWERIRWPTRVTFSDGRMMIVYGQRTADGRIAFGGRGAPYRSGSRVHSSMENNAAVHRSLEEALVDLFPSLRGVEITHRWGGPLGIHRDWMPSVGVDRATGLAWLGGYVGDGVAAANLAGRTVAELIVGQETERTSLPWVDRRSRPWEPEPLRTIGVRGGQWLASSIDRADSLGKPGAVRRRLLASLW